MYMRPLWKITGNSLLVLPRITARPGLMVQRASSSLMNQINHPHLIPVTPRYNFARKIAAYPWRLLSSASSSSGQTEPGKPPKPSDDALKKVTLESELKKVVSLQSQLTKIESRVGRHITSEPDKPIDIQSKKLGWMVSGTAIAMMTALFGKVYVLLGAVPLFLYHAKDLDVLSKTFGRDTAFLWKYSKCWLLTKRIKNDNMTLSKVFQQMERKHPDKIMLQMHDQNWKYKDVASYANRTSRLMQKYGFQKGDVVAMFALNSPEMVAIVLGMANLGIITTLISTELRNKGLTQAIKNSGCKGIIFDDELIHAFDDVYKSFDKITIFQMRHKAKQPEFRVLEEELLKEFNDLPEVFINVHHDDPLLYMYSPNDTVFREPIIITHEKFLFDSSAMAMMLDLRPSERIYIPTPLHETTGMILGIGPSITNSVCTVLKSKFSATDYFRECYVYNCNVGQYSGSMCKHLLLSPVSPIETFHPVRIMYGSGLESDYWQEFVNRFGTKMLEVHDASKDNINLINMEGKVGVVGFRPKLAPSFLFPHYVIKVFGRDNIPVRSDQGLCQLCEYGEPGMLIKLWTDSGNLPPKVKTIQNIFKDGDMAITNGEILTIDESLYLRPLKKHMNRSWMNKLVTSEEVEYIASKLTSKRCVAYSLAMGYKQDIEILAIEDPQKNIDMKKFTDDLVDHLPRNWVPHYVRIVNKFQMVSSKKVDKKRLVEQGLNMEGDLVHYFDKTSMCYKPLMWAKGCRPQMLVSESKVQPLAETKNAVPSGNSILSNVNKMAEKLKRLKAMEKSKKPAKACAADAEKNKKAASADESLKLKPVTPITPIIPKVTSASDSGKTTTHATASNVQEKNPPKASDPAQNPSETLANLLKDFQFTSPTEQPDSKSTHRKVQSTDPMDSQESKSAETSKHVSLTEEEAKSKLMKSSDKSDRKFASAESQSFETTESKVKVPTEPLGIVYDAAERKFKAASETQAVSSEDSAETKYDFSAPPQPSSHTTDRKIKVEPEPPVDTSDTTERQFNVSSESQAKTFKSTEKKIEATSKSQANSYDKTNAVYKVSSEPVMNKLMKDRMKDRINGEVKVPRVSKPIVSDDTTSVKSAAYSKPTFDKHNPSEVENQTAKASNVMELKTAAEDYKLDSKDMQQGESKEFKPSADVDAVKSSENVEANKSEDGKSVSNLGFGPAEVSKKSGDKPEEEEGKNDPKKNRYD